MEQGKVFDRICYIDLTLYFEKYWTYIIFTGIISLRISVGGGCVKSMDVIEECLGVYPKWVDNRQRKRKFEDLSGQKYGRLTVLYRTDDEVMSNGNKTPRYACVCECGDFVGTRATALRSGHTSSCMRCNRRESLIGVNLEDLTGQKFNRWLVLERAESVLEPRGRYSTVWKCECECGTIRNVRASALKGNITHSCGCYKYEQLSVERDLVGSSFGLWTVLEKSQSDYISPTNGRWYHAWICECECGTVRRVVEQSLVSNKTTSCGCTTEPSLEVYTREFLQELNIEFQKHKTFEGLRGTGNGLLSYDFAVYGESGNIFCLIECQGKQHYEPSEFFGGFDQFKIQLEHDSRKRLYAETMNIPLLEINYRMDTFEDVSMTIKSFLIDISDFKTNSII